MRIRSTKPEFWRSKTIVDALDWADRYVLKGLEAYVDDNGVGKDDLELIATEVFPRDTYRSPRECVARLTEAISRIHQAGLIARYEVDGEKLLYIDKWRDLQRIDRPSKGRYPRPDGTTEYAQPVNRDTYRSPRDTLASPRDTLATGTGEQGNRGTEEKHRPPVRTEQQSAATNDGRGKALAVMREANLTARSINAYRIAEAFSQSLPVPIEPNLLSRIGVQIDNCIKGGISPPAIAAGLRAWTDSDSFAPSQIPSYVHKAANRGRNGKPTAKALEYDQALTELLTEVTTL